jgi:hypothetical protein
MATSEIDKLERRYAENPHGLTFAPLAEVHRKNGDVTRALELLRIGLELHPNYIPASIVLGRCHQDLSDLPAAEEAFAHVLRLDDENVIALKSLADISERQDRLDDAERWLRRLVSVDRSNDEARQQLQRIQTAKDQSSRSVPTPAVISEVEVPHEIALVEATPPERRSQPAEVAPLNLTDDLVQHKEPPMAAKASPESLVPEPEPPSAVREPAPLAGLEPGEFEPPKVSTGPLGLEIETESDVVLNSSGASEFSVPDASQDFAALAAKMNASRPRTPGRRATDRAAAESRDVAAKSKQVAQAEPPRHPSTQPAAPAKAYSAPENGGQSIAAFFQALLLARPPAASAFASAHGGTTPPERDARTSSLSAKGDNASPVPSAAEAGKDGLVSFDDFFGSAAGGNSVAPGGGEPGKDDLDQFHSWLQNLKR